MTWGSHPIAMSKKVRAGARMTETTDSDGKPKQPKPEPMAAEELLAAVRTFARDAGHEAVRSARDHFAAGHKPSGFGEAGKVDAFEAVVKFIDERTPMT